MDIAVLFISIASMGGIGVALALILVVADKKLAVKEDPRVEQALEALPGINCGACGFAGCSAFATAVTEGKVSVTGCRPGGSEVAAQLARILGVEEGESETPKKARVFCSGGLAEAKRDKVYTGVRTCEAAHTLGGEKACLYSCIGFGDCVEVCPFDAMYMGENGLPVVDLRKCTGCGECVRACPRDIMGLTDADEIVHVYCRSRDKGPVVRKSCSAGCIACKLCEKDDETGAVKVVDNLSVIDYVVNKAPLKAIERCPTKVIRVSEPVPGFEKEKVAAGADAGG
jgi:Na+-translocating ferredoxin:NAD+ oxidoreductase RNF subunit RnfB